MATGAAIPQTLKDKIMDTIPFSQNWNNKLSARYYTTLRLASAKYQPGKKVNITLRKKLLHQAEMIDCKIIYMNQLNDFIIGLDMGLTLFEGKNILFKMYPTIDFTQQRMVLVLLRVIDYKKDETKSTLTELESSKDTETHEHDLELKPDGSTAQKSTPHNLTETQVHNSRQLNKASMAYLMHKMNG